MAYQNARRPCIAKRITSVKKVIYAIFFTPNGLAIQVSIPKGKSMNTRFCGSFMFLFCLVFAMFCARLFICAFWSPAGKGLTSWLSFVVSSVSLSLSHWYPGSGVVLDCIDS